MRSIRDDIGRPPYDSAMQSRTRGEYFEFLWRTNLQDMHQLMYESSVLTGLLERMSYSPADGFRRRERIDA